MSTTISRYTEGEVSKDPTLDKTLLTAGRLMRPGLLDQRADAALLRLGLEGPAARKARLGYEDRFLRRGWSLLKESPDYIRGWQACEQDDDEDRAYDYAHGRGPGPEYPGMDPWDVGLETADDDYSPGEPEQEQPHA